MSNDNRRGPGRGPMGHGRGMMPGEKAKDFKGTMKKLMSYLGKYTYAIIAVFIFAIGSVAFSVIGPKVLGKATTEIFNGLIGKISGGDGINFDRIKIILLTLFIRKIPRQISRLKIHRIAEIEGFDGFHQIVCHL